MREEEFIETVKNYTLLYDVHSSDYRDAKKRQEAWEEVGSIFNLTGHECRTIWTKLRNAYTNAIKRRKAIQGQGQGEKKFLKWKFEDQMSFLAPFTEHHCRIHSKFPSMLGGSGGGGGGDSLDDQIQLTDEDEPETPGGRHQVNSNSEQSSELSAAIQQVHSFQVPNHVGGRLAGIKRRQAERIDRLARIKRFGQARSQVTVAPPPQPTVPLVSMATDEVEMFYLSMSRTVKKLPKVEQIRIRMELCNLVSDAELRSCAPALVNQPSKSRQATPTKDMYEHSAQSPPSSSKSLIATELAQQNVLLDQRAASASPILVEAYYATTCSDNN